MADEDDMFADELHDDETFGFESAEHTGAHEALMAKRLEAKRRRKAAKAAEGPFLKRAFNAIRPAPLNHIKNNWITLLLTTSSAVGLGVAGQTVFGNPDAQMDIVATAKTAALAYPTWKIGSIMLPRVATFVGHNLNNILSDKYHETWMRKAANNFVLPLTFAAAALAGPFQGHKYFDAATDATIELPFTVFQGIPSGITDTFTNASNTVWDGNWELQDQGSCLQAQATDPSHVCLSGPGSEAFNVASEGGTTTIEISENILRANEGAEIGWSGRAFGVNPAFNTDWIPDRDVVNQWFYDKLGL